METEIPALIDSVAILKGKRVSASPLFSMHYPSFLSLI